MALQRGSSLPPGAGGGNPFWTNRAQEEWRLRMARPIDLPVPGEDEETRLELEGEGLPVMDVADTTVRRGRNMRSRDRQGASRSREIRDGEVPGIFVTPPSVTTGKGRGEERIGFGHKSSGRMPPEMEEGERQQQRSEGPVPHDAAMAQDSLRRALERGVVEQLHEENVRLNEKVDELMKKLASGQSGSDWSEVTAPRQQSPTRTMALNQPRFTPNGTRVPSGPPPEDESQGGELPELPRWPFPLEMHYEPVQQTANSRFMQLGSMGMENGRQKEEGSVQLNPAHVNEGDLPGHGMQSRQEQVGHQELFGRGMQSRQGQDGHQEICGPGARSRQELPHQEVMSAAEARAAWLEREIVSLKQTIEEEAKGNAFQRSEYWSKPIWKEEQEDREGDRAQQFHPGGQGYSRAQQLHPGNLGDSRAQQLHPGLQGDGRAFQECQGERQHGRQSHHGTERGHQQLVCRDLSDPGVGDKDPTGSKKEKEQEALRSNNPVLPTLPPVTQRNSAVDAADWLVEIRPTIADLSTSAGSWWSATMETTLKVYKEWLASTPLERLRIHPPEPVDPTSFGNSQQVQRLEQRVTTILLPSLPSELRHDLISARQLWPSAILYRILRSFQPGGWGERSMLLTELTVTSAAVSAMEASNKLRMWRRHRGRALELGATLPDVLLQVRALDVIVQGVLKQHPQTQFRVASYRMEANIDERPTDESLAQFLELLTAEMDTLQTGSTDLSKSPGDKPTNAAVKSMMTTSTNPCKFWGTENGCQKGKRCSYAHDWQSLEDRNARCFVCSSLQHRKAECPVRSSVDGMTEGGSGQGRGGFGKNNTQKGDGKSKTKGKGKDKGKEQETPNAKSMSTTTTPQPKVEEQGENGKGQGAVNASAKEGGSDGGTGSVDAAALMTEVTSLLRSMRADQNKSPQLSAVKLQRLNGTGQRTVLLDGGATHCLRLPICEEEWNRSREIQVQLASGVVTLRQNPESGSLLSMDKDVQPIIPLSALTQLGIKVEWDQRGCTMTRMDGRKLPVHLDSGCPVMERGPGIELLFEVEQLFKRRAGIRKVFNTRDVTSAVGCCTKEMAETARELARLFPQVPPHLIEAIPGDMELDMNKVPLNRRCRKRIMESKSLVIHLFSGKNTSLWTSCEEEGHVVLCVEVEKGLDMHNNALFGFLESLCRSGKVDALLAGPPCRTTSLQRHRDDGGPPPLRGRTLETRFGLPFITEEQHERCDQDSVLFLRTLWLCYLGRHGNPDMEITLEQPWDPEEWVPETRSRPQFGFPSFLSWPETAVIKEVCQLEVISFDQGVVGHVYPKPTQLLSNSQEVMSLNGRRVDVNQGITPWPAELGARLSVSKKAADWAPGLVDRLRKMIKRKQASAGSAKHPGTARGVQGRWLPWMTQRQAGDGEGVQTSSTSSTGLRALSAMDAEDWKQHILNDHQPCRRDCGVCLQNLGRDRPHRRIQYPSGYTLNVDIAGPYQDGTDQLETCPRYFMVGVFTVPVKNNTPLAEKLQQLSEASGSSAVVWPAEEAVVNPAVDPEELEMFAEVAEEERPALSEAEIQQAEVRNQAWTEMVQDLRDVQMSNLTLAIPLKSRHAGEVQKALTFFYCRLRSLGLPIFRIHSDRAREFTSRQLQTWMRDHDIIHTTTSGDEPQGAGRAEGEVGWLKGRVRLLLGSAKAPIHFWPLALRQASELRFRSQMASFGIRLPALIPFGTQAFAKFKRWHHIQDKDRWAHPMRKVTVYGPAADMSSTSKAYYILCGGRWLRSTVVVEAKNPQPLLEEGEVREGQEQQVEDLRFEEAEEEREGPRSYSPSIAPADEPMLDIEEDDKGKHLKQPVQLEEEPVRRRLHDKQPPPPAYQGPILRVLRIGGECSWGEVQMAPLVQPQDWGEHQELEEETDEENREDTKVGEQEVVQLQELDQLQQLEMRKLCVEKMAKMDQVTQTTMLFKMEMECEEIEERMESRNRKMEEKQREVLTSRTVTLDEVRNNLMDWKESLKAEYDSLMNHEAIEPITQEECRRLEREMEVETLPSMLVAVIKPPYKFKSRIVACGNFSTMEQTGDLDKAAGGLDSIVARLMISMAARNKWAISTIDVRTAFLQAPRRSTPGKTTILVPPAILREAGLLREGGGERWRVRKAMYGLVESPRDWSDHRDATLPLVRWKDPTTEKKYRLKKTAENHLWSIQQEDGGEIEGFLGVYVDDVIVIGRDELVDQALKAMENHFKLAQPSRVTPENSVSFCGYEISMGKDGSYMISQEKYLEELLKKYKIDRTESHPVPKLEEAEDENPIQPRDLKAAQTLAGELLWVMTRSRPDICYGVSVMTRLLHRRPAYVVQLGWHLLRYLHGAKSFGLKFDAGFEDANNLYIKTDTSFAPPVEKYRSIQGTALFHGTHLLQWSSSKQAFITLSTAEAELVGYTEGFQQAQSIGELLRVFGCYTIKHLEGDCKAALAQITSDATAWRTRHLRLRSSRLREAFLENKEEWKAHHVAGAELASDGCTKALLGQAFRRHRDQLGMYEVKKEVNEEKIAIKKAEVVRDFQDDVAKVLAGAGLALALTSKEKIGALLLAVAGLICVKGRWEKSESRPASKVSRPQQELREGANTPKGEWDEAAHPPIKGIAGKAQVFGEDPRDHCTKGAIGTPGFRAFQLSRGSSSNGMEPMEVKIERDEKPSLRAFRAVGDPSRDQAPLPPRNLENQRQRIEHGGMMRGLMQDLLDKTNGFRPEKDF